MEEDDVTAYECHLDNRYSLSVQVWFLRTSSLLYLADLDETKFDVNCASDSISVFVDQLHIEEFRQALVLTDYRGYFI